MPTKEVYMRQAWMSILKNKSLRQINLVQADVCSKRDQSEDIPGGY
jgi:hypothetical protein